MSETQKQNWLVYIVEASDGCFYTGITVDMQRRWQEHSSGRQGAKFFRGRKPRQLRFLEGEHTRSSASQREAQIKKLSRPQKLSLLDSLNERQSALLKHYCAQLETLN